MEKLIGREEEIKILKSTLRSGEAEMVSVIGRRRLGKTFLVKSVYGERILFETTGPSTWRRTRTPQHWQGAWT